MPTWERVRKVEDPRLPAGYTVCFHEIRGYDSPDRWYVAYLNDKPFKSYGTLDDAVNACIQCDSDERESLWSRIKDGYPL